MKRFLLAAVFAVTAISSSTAWAQQRESRGESGQPEQSRQQQRQGNQQGNQPQRQPQRQAQTQPPPQSQSQRQPQQQVQRLPQAQYQAQTQRQPQTQNQAQNQTQKQTQNPGQNQHQPRQQAQQSDPVRARAESQTQPPRQAQAQVQRQGGPAPRGAGFTYSGRQYAKIQAPSYGYPQGYGYRRWAVGQDLPMLFLSARYFFNSYDDYDIAAPPYGFHWVRYGPDLLLVSDRTGRIRQVIYGVFY